MNTTKKKKERKEEKSTTISSRVNAKGKSRLRHAAPNEKERARKRERNKPCGPARARQLHV